MARVSKNTTWTAVDTAVYVAVNGSPRSCSSRQMIAPAVSTTGAAAGFLFSEVLRCDGASALKDGLGFLGRAADDAALPEAPPPARAPRIELVAYAAAPERRDVLELVTMRGSSASSSSDDESPESSSAALVADTAPRTTTSQPRRDDRTRSERRSSFLRPRFARTAPARTISDRTLAASANKLARSSVEMGWRIDSWRSRSRIVSTAGTSSCGGWCSSLMRDTLILSAALSSSDSVTAPCSWSSVKRRCMRTSTYRAATCVLTALATSGKIAT
mmetsp:Transcript_6610/g.27765  ORF Transcript_6610/g.27765 Transcript_6610/m.27765 type:complete len:274 (+) Transcript_6610:1213-2034(+)